MDLVKTRTNSQTYANTVEKFKSFTDEINKSYPYDEKNPRAMVNLVSPMLKKQYDTQEIQNYIAMGEDKLEEMLKPSVTIKRIRLSLWNWYHIMHDRMQWKSLDINDGQISPERICLGVCNPLIFTREVLGNPLAMAYVFTAPVSYEVMVEEALSESMLKLREVLQMPLYFNGKDGEPKPNVKVAELMLKVAAFLDLRVHGAIPKVIRQDVRSVSYHQHQHQGDPAGNVIDHEKLGETLLSIEEIDKQIEGIRKDTESLIRYPSFKPKEQDVIDGLIKP